MTKFEEIKYKSTNYFISITSPPLSTHCAQWQCDTAAFCPLFLCSSATSSSAKRQAALSLWPLFSRGIAVFCAPPHPSVFASSFIFLASLHLSFTFHLVLSSSLSLCLPCSLSLAAAAVIVFYDALTYATIYFHFHYHSLSPFTYPLPAFSAAHFVMIKDGQNAGYLPRSCSLVRGI